MTIPTTDRSVFYAKSLLKELGIPESRREWAAMQMQEYFNANPDAGHLTVVGEGKGARYILNCNRELLKAALERRFVLWKVADKQRRSENARRMGQSNKGKRAPDPAPTAEEPVEQGAAVINDDLLRAVLTMASDVAWCRTQLERISKDFGILADLETDEGAPHGN